MNALAPHEAHDAICAEQPLQSSDMLPLQRTGDEDEPETIGGSGPLPNN